MKSRRYIATFTNGSPGCTWRSKTCFWCSGLGVLANFIGRFLGREVYGIPLSFLLLWVVPILAIPCLWLFKYGKPRGYLRDLLIWQIKPHIYCGLERDRELTKEYLK